VLALDAADGGAGQGSGQERVLAEVFEVAAVERVAGEVDPAVQQDVEALLPRLLADHGPAGEGDVGTPGGGQQHAGGQGGRVVVTASRGGHPEAGVALAQVRQAEARDAGDEAGGGLHARRRAGLQHAGEVAMDEGDLLVLGHLGERELGAAVGREAGVAPGKGPRLRMRRRRRQSAQRQGGDPAHPSALHGRPSPRSTVDPMVIVSAVHLHRDAHAMSDWGAGPVDPRTTSAKSSRRPADASTRDTVLVETPARAATSWMVTEANWSAPQGRPEAGGGASFAQGRARRHGVVNGGLGGGCRRLTSPGHGRS
jgi:hypothetical protein